MDEVERLVRTIFILHGQTYKKPLEERELRYYDYEEDLHHTKNTLPS